MERRKRHQLPAATATATASVRVGAYALEVGTPAGSFAEFDAASETENAQALATALAAEPSAPGRPVAAAEALNESAAAVTKRVEQAEDLFRAAAEGRLYDLESVSAEIDVLLAVLKRLDGAGRFEEQLRLLRALHGLLAVSLRWLDLIRALRRGLDASQAAGDRASEAWLQHELGALDLASGDPKTAAARFREALRLKEQLGDVTGRCATRHNLECAERELARASSPGGRPPRTRRQTALLTAVPLVALVLGVAAGRYQPAGDDADAAETEQQTTTVSQPRPPEAVDDGAATDEDRPLRIRVGALLENDGDPNGDDLVVTAVERIRGQTHGRVGLRDGVVVYRPDRNYNGPARFRYRISDGEGGRAAGSVAVAVEPVNDTPRARPDTLQLVERRSGSVDVLANDGDVDGDDLVVLEATDGVRGSVSCAPSGECAYARDAEDVGPDAFTYTVGDRNGGEAIAEVTVTIEPLPALFVDDVSVDEPAEGQSEATFTVALSEPTSSTVTVAWETGEYPGGASAEAKDFGAASGTLTFAPGDTEQTITVEIYSDDVSEDDERFFVRLLDAVAAELEDGSGDATIRDLEPEPDPLPEFGEPR